MKQNVLEINRRTILHFVRNAQRFLNLPKTLFECDVNQCNPALYVGVEGKIAIKRAKKGLAIIHKTNKMLTQLGTLLEAGCVRNKK